MNFFIIVIVILFVLKLFDDDKKSNTETIDRDKSILTQYKINIK